MDENDKPGVGLHDRGVEQSVGTVKETAQPCEKTPRERRRWDENVVAKAMFVVEKV